MVPAPSPEHKPPWRSPTTWMLLAALALSVVSIRPYLTELGAGLVFGYVSERPIAWVLRRINRLSRPGWQWGVATAFAFLISLVVLVPAVIAVWVALRELGALISSSNAGSIDSALGALSGWIRRRLGPMGNGLPVGELTARIRTLAEDAGTWLARTTAQGLTAAPDALFSVFVVMTAWVTFAVKGRRLRERILPRLIPWPRQRAILRRSTADVIDSVVLANVGVSGVQAAVVSVASVALQVPHAIVWGVVSFVLSFVPVVGTALVTVTATLYLYLAGRTGAAIIMAIVAVFTGGIDNVLRPMLARGSTELPFLWMLVAFVGGLVVFGAPGVILGPLFLSWSVALWEAREEENPVPGLQVVDASPPSTL